MQSSSDDAIVAFLATRRAPASLQEVASAIQLSPSQALRQLRRLVEEGFVQRSGQWKTTRYSIAPAFHVAFTSPPTDDNSGLAQRWTAREEPDWRFPLASRLPDEKGRASLVKFLERMHADGAFTPWLLSYVDLQHDEHNLEWANLSPDERGKRIRHHANHGTANVYAFGSCARGEAHADSDLDLVLVHDLNRAGVPSYAYEAHVAARVADLNLGTPRRLDVKVYREDEFFDGLVDLPARVRESILRDGITVHTTAKRPRYIERNRESLKEALEAWTKHRD